MLKYLRVVILMDYNDATIASRDSSDKGNPGARESPSVRWSQLMRSGVSGIL